jgi:hypothetical protein
MTTGREKRLFRISLGFALLFMAFNAFLPAQNTTRISGKVIDAVTKEPLPFVNISFVNKNIGTITDYNGKYKIETTWASGAIQASFIGYNVQTKKVAVGKNQKINFELQPVNIVLNEVEIKAKKVRYRNKNNPAVTLIRNVIKNKSLNRMSGLDYYEYDKYEKDEFDINNFTEKFKNKKSLKKFQYVFNYVDTSKINGKPFLPVFLKETRSKVYYRKSPKKKREYILGTKMIGFHEYIDNQGVGFIIDNLFQEMDIYDNNIMILTNTFTGPVSTIAPAIYKFHIIDTLDINGYNCIRVDFLPRNKKDFAFTGSLYITNDDRYAIIKGILNISHEINLNFVNDLRIIQEYRYINDKAWGINTDKLIVDFNISKNGVGIFGRKSVFYDNFLFDVPRPDSVYKGVETVVRVDNYDNRKPGFWEKSRLVKLSEQEKNIYIMTDSIKHIPAFRRTMDVLMLLVAGYWNFDKIDVGPVNTFYSFNDVEGFRLRLGGRTSDEFSKKIRINGYGIYGFKDKRFKYSLMGTFSLNNKSLMKSPKHYLSLRYQYETNFPGMEVEFINEDNFLLSFKRGVADKILYNRMFNIDYYRDWSNGFSTTLSFRNLNQEPGGNLFFKYENDLVANSITTTDITLKIRLAPDEKFYQGIDYKTPIITNKPIFQLYFSQNIKGVLGSEYTFSKVKFSVFKRFYWPVIGYTNTTFEVGKLFGKAPYILLFLPRANQTYSYQLLSYNMMNFLEFVNDQYVSFFVEHHFNGFILNKIPLMKNLKWRSIISFKGLYGNITDKNNPEVTSGLMLFPTDQYGNPTTFSLKSKPYIEVSVGVGNIFKFFRVDLLRRVTYLENPNVSRIGVRARFKFDF